MNTNNNYIELRRLLEGWYAARLTPAEEARLYALLADPGPLPADLEADRSMILAIREAADQTVEIPAEKAQRIEAALEREMAAERMAAAATKTPRPLWRRWIWQGAAAVAVLAIGATFLIRTGDNSTPEHPGLAEVTTPITGGTSRQTVKLQTAEDSIVVNTPIAVAPEASDIAQAEKSKKPAKKHHTDKHHKGHNKRKSAAHGDSYEYDATEARLVAANYHVVTEQREADAMLAAIFGRLESQMSAESVKMAEITADYQSEMTKLSIASEIN